MRKTILSEASRLIPINENGQEDRISIFRASLRMLGVKAAKGNVPAIRHLTNIVCQAEHEELSEKEDLVRRALKYKTDSTEYIRIHKEHGLKFEMPIPHPDHIEIDYHTLEIACNGPMDRKSFDRYKAAINKMVSLEFFIGLDNEESDDPKFQERQTEERQQNIRFLNGFRENIPVDDPLWLEYAPVYRKSWIDWWYYYGPDPHIPEEDILQLEFEKSHPNLKSSFTTGQKMFMQSWRNSADEFREFMRNKLKELYGDVWFNRLSIVYHHNRDVELDRMRYAYEMGTFDPNNYEMTDEDRELFADEEFITYYMDWHRDLPDI